MTPSTVGESKLSLTQLVISDVVEPPAGAAADGAAHAAHAATDAMN